MDEVEPAIVQFHERQIEECHRRYERGDTSQLVLALRHCIFGRLPLPAWLAPEAWDAMEFFFRKGGARGKGKTGRHLIRYKRQRMHRMRHQVAAHELAKRDILGGGRQDAFERARIRLVGNKLACGSTDAIERSFNKVQAMYRDRGNNLA